MNDVSSLLKLTKLCRDLEKTAIEQEIIEQLKIWAIELAGMAQESPGLFRPKWPNDLSRTEQGARLQEAPCEAENSVPSIVPELLSRASA